MSEQNLISKYVPNFITLLSLSSGFTSISFSLNGEWEIAIYLILLATIFDFFDGWFARKLKSGSNFGAELDSLSDFVSFGVAPSFLIYLWSTNTLGSLGWGATLFFVICSALRLARFTADNYITNKPIDKLAIQESCEISKLIVTIEEHSVIGGLGSAVAEQKAQIKNSPPQMFIGLPDKYGKGGTYEDLKSKYGLLPKQIVDKIIKYYE